MRSEIIRFSTKVSLAIKNYPFVKFSIQLLKNFVKGKILISGSYSQSEEDCWLNNWLPEDNGFYLDIGSGQPVLGSNTYLFYKRGWSGILIDPIPRNVLLSRMLRGRDRIYKACISDEVRLVNFWEFQPYEYSTLSEIQANQVLVNNLAVLKKIHQIKTMSIRDIQLDISPTSPSFLSIDTEGLDFLILSSIDWSVFLPRLVCVEGGDLRQDLEIDQLLQSKGYKLVKELKLSSIYLHSDFCPE